MIIFCSHFFHCVSEVGLAHILAIWRSRCEGEEFTVAPLNCANVPTPTLVCAHLLYNLLNLHRPHKVQTRENRQFAREYLV